MNRRSLFGRLATSNPGRSVTSKTANRTAERQDYFRVHLEPLEDRRLLSASTTYVNDNWVDIDLGASGLHPSQPDELFTGDHVVNSLDSVAPGTITAIYGNTAFGTVVNTTNPNAGLKVLDTDPPVLGNGLINDAIQNTSPLGTLNVLDGTYRESDIVIDRAMTFQGSGQSGASQTLIVPEVSSSGDLSDFGVGTHQGIIIYSADVTVKNVHLDGSGNGSVAGSMNYHQGITTLYNTQAGGSYHSLHNGALPLKQLGVSPDYRGNLNETVPNLLIDHVTVDNTFWHGVTISPLADKMFDAGDNQALELQIENSTINNVGVGAGDPVNRIGILLQNLHEAKDSTFGNAIDVTISNVGVGITTKIFSASPLTAASYDPGDNFAHNRAALIRTTVNDAVFRGYDFEFLHERDDIGLVANFSNPANTAVGVYLYYGSLVLTGASINGAKIGMQLENTQTDQLGGPGFPVTFEDPHFTGPGSGVAGSVGILLENSVAQPHSVSGLIAAVISGYETGIKIDQLTTASDTGVRNTAEVLGTTFSGNATDIAVGTGGTVIGTFTSNSISVTGDGQLTPGYPNGYNSKYYTLTPGNVKDTTAEIFAPPAPDVLPTGNVTLASTSTYNVLLTGQTGATVATGGVDLFNFNQTQVYTFTPPPTPVNGLIDTPFGFVTNAVGTSLSQNASGNGQLVLKALGQPGGSAINGTGLDYFFGTNSHLDSIVNGVSLYRLDSTDISNRTYLNIVAKAGPGNQARVFGVGLIDGLGNANLWTIPYSVLNSLPVNGSGFATVPINLMSPSIDLTGPNGADHRLDYKHIAGYVFGGDQGTLNGVQNLPWGLNVDDIFASGFSNAQLKATGTVNLGGATLNVTAGTNFEPIVSQKYTIVKSTSLVVGTFAGLAEGATLTIGGKPYQINYNDISAGGHDVVLTGKSPVLDLNGADVNSAPTGVDFSSTWVLGGAPVNITNATTASVADLFSTTLNTITVTISAIHTGDVLSASSVPAGISANYNSTSEVLTLTKTGAGTLTDFQTALRSIKYNNIAVTGPGVSPVTVTFVADDGTNTSTVATATITTDQPSALDLNGTVAGGTFHVSVWTQTGPVLIADPSLAVVTDTDSPNLASITATISTFHTGDVLAASPPPGISANYNNTSGVLTLTNTGSGTLDNFQAALRTITYNNIAATGPAVPAVLVNIVADDGVLKSAIATATITNSVPLVDLNGDVAGLNYSTAWLGNASSINVEASGFPTDQDTKNATVSDGDSVSLVSMTLTIVGGAHPGDDLTASLQPGITKTFLGGVLTLSGTATVDAYQKVLRTVAYTNSGSPGVKSVQIDVVANDGTHPSPTVTTTLTTSIPTVALSDNVISVTPLWVQGGGPILVADPANHPSHPAVVGDTVGGTLASVTAIIFNHRTGDVLSATPSGDVTFNWDGTSVLTLKPTGSLTSATFDDFQNVLRTVTYDNTSGVPGDTPAVLYFQANDGVSNSIVTAAGTFTLPQIRPAFTVTSKIVTDANEPVIKLNDPNPGFPSTWSGSALVITNPATVSVTDADNADLTQITASITNPSPGDVLSATPSGNVTFSYNGSVIINGVVFGVLTLKPITGLTAPMADFDAVLQTVNYNNISGGPLNSPVLVNFVATDGYSNFDYLTGLRTPVNSGVATASITSTIAVPPVITIGPPSFPVRQIPIDFPWPASSPAIPLAGTPTDLQNAVEWNQNGPVYLTDVYVPTILTDSTVSNTTVTDVSTGNLTSMTITITNPHTGDILAVNPAWTTGFPGTFITDAWNGTDTLTLSGTDSVSSYQGALKSLTYNNTAANGPGVSTVNVTIVGQDANSEISATAKVTIAIDRKPTLDLDGSVSGGTGNTSAWTNGGGPVIITDSTHALTADGDSTNLAWISAIISNPHAGDVLSATPAGTVKVQYDAARHTLLLSGTDTLATYQTVLRSITYDNTAGGPGASPVLVKIESNDGFVNSSQVVATITNSTAQFPGLDLDGFATAPTGFTTSWANLGAVNITGASPLTNIAAVVDGGSTTLISITATERAIAGAVTTTQIGNGGQDAIQSIAPYLNTANAGTFTLHFAPTALTAFTTGPITFNGSAALVQAAIEAADLGILAPGAIVVAGGPLTTTPMTFTFSGAGVTHTAQPLITIDVSKTGGHSAGDVLSGTTGLTNVTANYNSTSGVLTLKPITGTSAALDDFQTVLRTVKYNNISGGPGAGVLSETIDFVPNDGTNIGHLVTAIVNVDIPPVLDLDGSLSGGTGFTSTWTGGAGPVHITASIPETVSAATVTDADTATLASITVTEALNHDGDIFAADSFGNVSASFDGLTVLTLAPISGTSASLADFQEVLRKITYDNTSAASGPVTTSFTAIIVANDGAAPSLPTTATINVVAPPLIDLNGGPIDGNNYTTVPDWTNSGQSTVASSISLVLNGEGGALTGMTIALAPVHPGDVLAMTSFLGSPTQNYNSTTGILTLSGSKSIGIYQSALHNITYNNISGGPGVSAVTVNFQGTDGIHLGNIAVATIPISGIHPVLKLSATRDFTTPSWTFGGAIQITDQIGTLATILDGENANLNTLSVHVSSAITGDILSFTGSPGSLAVSPYNPITGTLLFTGPADLATFQTVLRSITYNNSVSPSGPGTATVTFTINDGLNLNSPVATATIPIVAATNTAPFVDLDGGLSGGFDFSKTWNGTAVGITAPSDATVTDNSNSLASITASITGYLSSRLDFLSLSSAVPNIASNFNTTSGVLTLSPSSGSSASTADFQAALRKVTYNNTNGGPGLSSETVNFVATDADGVPLSSITRTATITVSIAPVIDLDGSLSGSNNRTSANWFNAGAVAIAAPSDATVFDGEGANLTGMTISVVGVHTGDALSSVASFNGVTVVGIGGNTLTLSGTAPVSDYQHVLRTVTYNNTNGGPGVNSITVNFVGSDGTLSTNTAVATVPVVNAILDLDGVLSGGTGFSSTWINNMLPYAQGSGGGNVFITGISNALVNDAESGTLTQMTVSIVGVHTGDFLSASNAGTSIGAPVYSTGTGVLTFTGSDTLAHYQTALRTVKYTNIGAAGGPVTTSVTANVQAKDSLLNFSNIAVATIAVSVPPIVDLNGNAGGLGYTSVWTNIGTPAPVAITDPTVGISGASVIDGRSANLTQLTATIVPFNANNVLAANTTGTIITATYVPGTGVLTLSGTDTTANYQKVLRTITYNNTGGGPGAGPIAVNFVGTDGVNSSATAKATIIITTTTAPNVVGRNIFYNKSGFDGAPASNLAVNVSDDAAIASDKVAYIAGTGAATFANVTSYDKGINGIMIDIKGGHGTISAADFIFKVGNSNVPSNASAWTTAGLTPLTVTTRTGAGAGGSDRVEITWDNGPTAGTGFSTIAGKWLEVILKGNDTVGGTAANTNTLLAASDVFFFGNAPGETGDGPTIVNATDIGDAQKNPRALANPATVSFNFDFSRDKNVNATDIGIAQGHTTTLSTALKLINVSGAGPFAPLPGGAGPATSTTTTTTTTTSTTTTDAGVASALASTSTSSSTPPVNVPGWIANRLQSVDLNNGQIARIFQHLHDVNTPGTRAVLVKIDQIADSLGLDDALLDRLLVDLGLE